MPLLPSPRARLRVPASLTMSSFHAPAPIQAVRSRHRHLRALEAPEFELDTAASCWQASFDAAQRALRAAGGRFGLPPAELKQRGSALVTERQEIARLLEQLARETGVPAPWISPVALTPRMLGLADRTTACLFDMDGVLTDSAAIHAAAWAEVFDGLLLGVGEKTARQFRPFDVRRDYRAYVDGKTRLEAVHGFLDSRGIRLPEGRRVDVASAQTAWGLANRKGEIVARMLRGRGVTGLPGARRYLQACGYAGIARAVVSASANTRSMLQLARLGSLVEANVDAAVMQVENLPSRPDPSVLLAACRRLGASPGETVSFTHSPAGVVAAHAAGMAVVGVAEGKDAQLLRAYGAERVVPSLAGLTGVLG